MPKKSSSFGSLPLACLGKNRIGILFRNKCGAFLCVSCRHRTGWLRRTLRALCRLRPRPAPCRTLTPSTARPCSPVGTAAAQQAAAAPAPAPAGQHHLHLPPVGQQGQDVSRARTRTSASQRRQGIPTHACQCQCHQHKTKKRTAALSTVLSLNAILSLSWQQSAFRATKNGVTLTAVGGVAFIVK
jgi:hypothetical protein